VAVWDSLLSPLLSSLERWRLGCFWRSPEVCEGGNADLADRLDTDQSQVSRAGRKLRELGLATRVRTGRLNGWTITTAGEREASRLRSSR
jgi:DNA-binding MarR family transcriptional regulator